MEEEGKEQFVARRVGEGGSVVLDMDHLRLEHTVAVGVGVARTAFTKLIIRIVFKRKEGPSD